MPYLSAHYSPWGVLASVLIAMFASYVALDLARRVYQYSDDRASALAWWICGSLALGTGIWSMHFVGMLSFSLPIALGYAKLLTLLSWLSAVLVSAMALSVATRRVLSAGWLTVGALTMGAGICCMHYMGMAAMGMTPGIQWNPWLVFASGVIAVGASAVALSIFFWMRQAPPDRARTYQAAAAAVMGLAISGMHYTGMAAASFRAGTICTAAGSLAGTTLGASVVVLSVLLLALTMFASILDVRRRLAASLAEANAKLQEANEKLQQQAFIDALTRLPNRLLFEDRLAQAISRLEQGVGDTSVRRRFDPGAIRGEMLAVLFVDLDGFKPINDSFGHAAGDKVLVEVAQRLSQAIRHTDTAARLGGDEFVLLLEGVSCPGDCIEFANQVLEILSRPIQIGGNVGEVCASIGIALYPDHGTADELLAHADAAMYAAKRAGGASYAMFEPHMDTGVRDRLALQNDLRHARERDELRLYYQPKFQGGGGHQDGVVTGAEALVRWVHPQRGLICPDEFIQAAERIGVMKPLGDWVIDEACRQMREWLNQGIRLPVSINLSVHQLLDPELTEHIEGSLRRHQIEPGLLLCEITESAAMENLETTLRVFGAMGRIGVYLSIDDFGTGYSSLSRLRQMPARELKIDRSFVTDLEASRDSVAVVDAVIRLAHALDLRVVAEGVETEGQKNILYRLNCDEVQGYLFAEPMPARALTSWLARTGAGVTQVPSGPLVVARP